LFSDAFFRFEPRESKVESAEEAVNAIAPAIQQESNRKIRLCWWRKGFYDGIEGTTRPRRAERQGFIGDFLRSCGRLDRRLVLGSARGLDAVG